MSQNANGEIKNEMQKCKNEKTENVRIQKLQKCKKMQNPKTPKPQNPITPQKIISKDVKIIS